MDQPKPREFFEAVLDVILSSEREKMRRSDGYVPVCEDMILASAVGGGTMPPADAFRYLMTAGRRLDGAHVLLERTRSLVDELKPIDDQYRRDATQGFFDDQRMRQHFFQMVNEAEMTVIALHRAIKMVERASRDLQLAEAPPLPEEVQACSEAIKTIRDSYEHIDDRVMGKVNRRGKTSAEAYAATMQAREGLLGERRWKYLHCSVGIDAEATTLMVELRDHLWKLWTIASWGGQDQTT